jgi:hypothetical protein
MGRRRFTPGGFLLAFAHVFEGKPSYLVYESDSSETHRDDAGQAASGADTG